MAAQTSATRAQLFMRQCRIRQTLTLSHLTTRLVSSSHLAPSNFSKPLRTRDLPSEQQEDRRLPSQKRTSRRLQSFQQQTTTTLPPPITEVVRPHIPNGFLSFLKYRVLNLPMPKAPITPPPFNLLNNPYRARKSWPPDFRLLDSKQQFHFEKLYRRRLLTKTMSLRYNWNRYTKLLQNTLIIITLLYFVFIADPWEDEGGGTPVDGFRAWFYGKLANFEPLSDELKEQASELQVYYKNNWRLHHFNTLREQKAEDDQRVAAERAEREAEAEAEKGRVVEKQSVKKR